MKQKFQTLPRWLIFSIDLSVVIGAFFISYFLAYSFRIPHSFTTLYPSLIGIIVINSVLFYMLKTYAGVVRYTNFADAFRILIVNTIASFIYAAISILYYKDFQAVIPINFIVVCGGLIGYRILVRHLYKRFFTDQLNKLRTKAAIFNTGEEGMLTKRLISDYSQSQINVVAFIDESFTKKGKQLDGIPIYSLTDAGFEKLVAEKVELLVLSSRGVTKQSMNLAVDLALKYNIKVQQVPPIKQWMDGKMTTDKLKNINIEDLLEREVIRIENEKIYQQIKGKKILVTGAAGSIGSELVRQLITYKPNLLVLCDMAETPLHELCLELTEKYPNAPIKSYIGDICDKVRMEHLFEVYSPEIVYHAAAYKHVPLMEDNPSVAVMNNVLGTKIIAELAEQNGIEKFVMVSTDKAVNPTNVMGASKRIAEIFTQSFFRDCQQKSGMHSGSHNTKFVTTRFGNVLGSNGSVIPRFKKQLEQGGPITITHPEITRYFMTIPEACQLILEAGAMGQGGEIFVFDMGKPVKIVDLAEKMIRLSGSKPGEDVQIVFTGLRPGEKLYEELLNDLESTQPTYHHKIMIAAVREYDFAEVNSKIDELILHASKHYTIETVMRMKQLVPEFISNNSTFESLDIKQGKL